MKQPKRRKHAVEERFAIWCQYSGLCRHCKMPPARAVGVIDHIILISKAEDPNNSNAYLGTCDEEVSKKNNPCLEPNHLAPSRMQNLLNESSRSHKRNDCYSDSKDRYNCCLSISNLTNI